MKEVVKNVWEVTYGNGERDYWEVILVVADNIENAVSRAKDCLAVLRAEDKARIDAQDSPKSHEELWEGIRITEVVESDKKIKYWE